MPEQLCTEFYRIIANTDQGTLDVALLEGEPIIRSAVASACVDGTWRSTVDLKIRKWTRRDTVDDEGRPVIVITLECQEKNSGGLRLGWSIEIHHGSPLLRLRLVVENDGSKPVTVEALRPLVIDTATGGAIRHGTNASDYHILINTEGEGVAQLNDLSPAGTSATHEGWWDAGLHDRKAQAGVVIGALAARRFKTQIHVEGADAGSESPVNLLWLEQMTYERSLQAGQHLPSEPVAVNFVEPTEVAYRMYAHAAGREMDARTLAEVPGGWNSWYVPYTAVDERFVLENARVIASRPDVFPKGPDGFNYVLIDYGWQSGDPPTSGANEWDTAKFPRGMAAVAQDIRALGLKPGLWIAPAQISCNTRAFQRFPHIGVRSSKGGHFLVADWMMKCGAMVPDCTLEAGRRYVQEQIREIVCDWGYELIVLEETDIAACWKGSLIRTPEGALIEDPEARAIYHDPDITPLEHYRLLVRTCIDAARASGAEVFVMPCGGPHLSNTGLFSMNVCSPDGAWGYHQPDWDGEFACKVQPQNLAYRYYMHNNLWTVDREGYCVSSPRPMPEAIMDICSAALSGGVSMNGDDLPYIAEERMQIIARCQPFYGKAARPIGLFDEKHPPVWDLKVRTDFEEWDMVAVFNYARDLTPVTTPIEFARLGLRSDTPYLAFDFWSSEFLGEHIGALDLPVPGQAMRLIGLRKTLDRPQVLGTDVHYTMGGKELLDVRWTRGEDRLQIVYRCPRMATGRVFLHVPEGWRMRSPSPYTVAPEHLGGPVWVVTIPASHTTTAVEILFDREAGR